MALPGLRPWACAALLCAAPLAAAQPSGAAARVNGATIPLARLEQAFSELLASQGRSAASIRNPATYKLLRRQALERLVEEELLWQEADRAGLRAVPDQVERALAEARERSRGAEGFRLALSRRGLTESEYREQLLRQLSIDRWVERELAPRAPGEKLGPAVAARLSELRAAARVELLAP